jgi:hypothetical protein
MAATEFQQAPPAADEMAEAMTRWDNAAMARFAEELDKHEAKVPTHPATSWLASMRADHPGVHRVTRIAHAQERWRLCWRIAARIGGCVVDGVSLDEALKSFDLAVDAARRDQQPLGEIDTLLAKAALLVEVERYAGAFAVLNEATVAIRALASEGFDRPVLTLRHAIIHRKRAEAFLQAAAFDGADRELAKAHRQAVKAEDEVELTLLRILRAERHHIVLTLPGQLEDLDDDTFDDLTRYRYYLVLSESERRQTNWDNAAEFLDRAMRLSAGDIRRQASIHYRLSRLRLEQWAAMQPQLGLVHVDLSPDLDGPAAERARLLRIAIRSATVALTTFKRIDDNAGEVRARIQLSRALSAAKMPIDAQVECDKAYEDLRSNVGEREVSFRPLLARIARARGEILMRRHDRKAAFREFALAGIIFVRSHDWSSQAAVNTAMHITGYGGGFPQDSWPSQEDSLSFGARHDVRDIEEAHGEATKRVPRQRRPEAQDERLLPADDDVCC